MWYGKDRLTAAHSPLRQYGCLCMIYKAASGPMLHCATASRAAAASTTPSACSFQSRQLASRWESNPPLSNGGKRLTHRVSAARRIAIISPMAWDPDTRPTRTTSRARRLPAHALRRISSTFSASDRRSGGASPTQALAWRCQRRRYGWTTSAPVRLPSFHPRLII